MAESAAESMAQLATRAHDAEREECERLEELRALGVRHMAAALPLPPLVEGRVFTRFFRYHLLPPQLQVLADAAAVFLVAPEVRGDVFATGRWRHPSARGPCVRGRKLLVTLEKFVRDTQDGVSDAADAAREIAEALVLAGFVSPVHELADETNAATNVRERDYYELVAPGAQQLVNSGVDHIAHVAHPNASVWAVVDGATRAGSVYRKRDAVAERAGGVRAFLSALALCRPRNRRERKRYAVVNKTVHHALFVFADDCARYELSRVALADALVRFEVGAAHAPLRHALKVWTEATFEILDFVAKRRQESWLLALLDAGATYVEAHPSHAEYANANASFYALSDTTAAGEHVAFEALQGQVVLLVNVARGDPATAQQLSELEALAESYAASGLCVLACLSDQFAGDDDDDDGPSEDAEAALRCCGASFPVLATRDVNGPAARPAFLFLNARLPGRFGPFTAGNLTKFLVDRRGQPVKRYEPTDAPLAAMESDVRRLLKGDDASGGE